MYDLRVVVDRVEGFCDTPMREGDYFEVIGNKLIIPENKTICIWALQSMMPFFPAKQRTTNNSNDWLPKTEYFSCPDPNGRVIFKIELVDPKTKKIVKQEKKIKRLLIDQEICTGCRCCELACSFSHFDLFSDQYARIKVAKDEINGTDSPNVCRQCGVAQCVVNCPFDALSKDKETDSIVVDKDKCTGCKVCLSKCPFDAITFISDYKFPLICDLCNGNPECVKACSVKAIRYEEQE